MKKLLLALLLIPSSLYADSVTSGSLGLLIPSTGVIDTSRRLDDKYNGNFRMISSTVSEILTRFSDIATSTTSINSTVTAIRTSTAAVESTLSQRTQVWYDEGTALTGGDIKAVNVVGGNVQATQSGSTVTITISGSGTSGGSSFRAYTLYVGTPGTPNVDAVIGGPASFDAMFASVAARGLTYGSSVTATIYMNNGVYSISNTTIPAGIEIHCGSSVTFTPTNFTDSIFTVYGKIFGPRFDVQSRAFNGRLVDIKGGGQVLDIRSSTGVGSMVQTGALMSFFRIESASNVVITGNLTEFASSQQDLFNGGLAFIDKSTDVYINLNTNKRYGGTGSHGFSISRSERVTIDGKYRNSGGRMINLEGGVKSSKIGGSHHITEAWNSGYIYVRGLSVAAPISSGVWVNQGEYIVDGVGTSANIVWLQGDFGVFAVTVTDNISYCTEKAVTCPANFVRVVDVGVHNTIIANNHVFKMGLVQDAGTATTYTSLANTNDTTKP